MIVTLTANPSIDRTMELPAALRRDEVNRASAVIDQPGGKGINVANVLAAAGADAVAVLPADDHDPLVTALRERGLPVVTVPTGSPCRVNVTVSEPDGTTTKINAPGTTLGPAALDALCTALLASGGDGDWAVLAGSLPAGVPAGWYAEVVATLRAAGRRVAVDTSGDPLIALMSGTVLPDLIKPNSDELAMLTGDDPHELERDVELAITAAHRLIERGIGAILLTLGGAGAALITAERTWRASPPTITVRSTVGAGDSSLAGYLLADERGLAPDERLRHAVAYGSAAASLPGTTTPGPADLDLAGVAITEHPARNPRH